MGVGGLGLGVWGLGFGVWGLGFGVWGLGFGACLQELPIDLSVTLECSGRSLPIARVVHVQSVTVS